MQKGVLLRDVVGEEDCVGAAVKDLRDALEGLLARRVPDLEFERDAFDPQEQIAEFDAYRNFVVFQELVVAHAVHQAGLADCGVADDYQLEDVLWLGAYHALPHWKRLTLKVFIWSIFDLYCLLFIFLT